MTGTIVTFYSYKGGVGRTFALANTAVVLARWGYRTLCVDWDLDAPGLDFYLLPHGSPRPSTGLVDLITAHTADADPDPVANIVRVDRPETQGRLDLLPAGGSDRGRYIRQVQELDWDRLYRDHDLGGFLERCRNRWKDEYDVVLVDSRTGITDIGGICSAQLPDILVMLFTANEQSLRGTLDIAERAWKAHDALPYDRGGLLIVPVPSRFDAREEYERADSWQQRFARDLRPLVETWMSREVPVERLLGHLTIPYVSYWSFGEDLPALVEPEPAPDKISYSLEALAALLAHRLERTELLAESRDSFVAAAARAARRDAGDAGYDVFVSAGPANRALAERLSAELTSRGLRLFLPSLDVAFAASWSPVLEDGLASSRNLVVLVGDDLERSQSRELERFLRQALDEDAERLVIPVYVFGARTGPIPTLLAQFRPERLRDDSDEALAGVVHRIVRDVSATRAAEPGPIGSAVRDDALDVLGALSGWQLDALRWALVEDGVAAMEQALDESDEAALQSLAAELEMLGPVRVVTGRGREVLDMPTGLRERVDALGGRLRGDIAARQLEDSARAALVARLDRFAAGERHAVEEPSALTAARRYAALAGSDDLEAEYLLGLFHHLRSVDRADRPDDRAAAVRHFTAVYRVAPDRVPESLRAEVGLEVPMGREERAAWTERMHALLEAGRASAERSDFDDAVWLAYLIAQQARDADAWSDLSRALHARYRRWRDPADIDAAVDVARTAADLGFPDSPPVGPSWPRYMTGLGLALADRFERTGDLTDLDEAISAFARAVGNTVDDAPMLGGQLSNLAAARSTRFLRTGDLADLDAAVELFDRAIQVAATDADRAAFLANRGTALSTRFRQLGDSRDLDEAVRCLREAAAGFRPDDPDRVIALSGLGLALRTRYQRTGTAADLSEAVVALEEALRRAPAGAVAAGVASNLSTALRVRFDASRNRVDADRSIRFARGALEESDADDARQSRYLSNLGAALTARARVDTSSNHVLDEAVQVLRTAAQLAAPDEPVRATVLANLGLALRGLAGSSGEPELLVEAARSYREAADIRSAAPVVRATSAREWAAAAAAYGNLGEAMQGYSVALDLLGSVTPRWLPREDQQDGLRRLGGLGAEAAAVALVAGEPARALALLEQGRGVLLAQELETRSEAGDLRALEPELVTRFVDLRRLLNDPSWPDRRRLVAQWDDLLDEIRTRPGFARFLRTPDPDELAAAVGAGPLVAVVVAARRCDAIIVRNGTIEALPLPDLTYDAVHERATAFLTAVHGDDLRRDEVVADVLGWLWDTVAEPVLDHLEFGEGPPQRLWWMPTGPLSVLPLAAAGRQVRPGDSVLDRAASSTVPTIRALTHARRNEVRPRDFEDVDDMLIVVMPTTPGLPALPAAATEAREVAAEVRGEPTVLVGDAATTAEVLEQVGLKALAHFACHARVDLADPSHSGLVVTNGTVTVRALSALDNPRARLAFLSACSTAFGGGELLDEAVHVASAFQLAGYPHVIATMWPVGDLAARRFARLTYRRLANRGDPALVVRGAVQDIRRLLPDRPTVWAAHVHHGP